MTTSVTLRATKGTPLTHNEVDDNFTNLKTTADAAAADASTAINAKANASAVGVAAGDSNMGTYTGSTIPDNETAKQNIQSLETAVETKANASAVGVTASAANMGTFTGSTISDNGTAKAAMQELETALELHTFASITASEDLTAGNLVNIHSSSGAKIRKANATDETKPADAFVLSAITSAASGLMYFPGKVITGLSGLTAGARYYLSTTGGGVTSTPPSAEGNLVQEVGVALSATSLLFSPKNGVLL